MFLGTLVDHTLRAHLYSLMSTAWRFDLCHLPVVDSCHHTTCRFFVFMFVFLLFPSFSVFCLFVHSDILSIGRLQRSANFSGFFFFFFFFFFFLSFAVHAECTVDDSQSEIDPPPAPPASQFKRPSPSPSPSPGVFRPHQRNTARPLSYPPTHSPAHPSSLPLSISIFWIFSSPLNWTQESQTSIFPQCVTIS